MSVDRAPDPCPPRQRTDLTRSDGDVEGLLHQLIADEAIRRDGDASSLRLIAVSESSRQVLRAVESGDTEQLLGVSVGHEWPGVIAVAESVVATAAGRREKGRLAVGVWSDGTEACTLETSGEMISARSPKGWLVDACRRTLGLQTAECDVHPLELPVAAWLDALMVRIVHGERALTWREAATWCPVPDRWRSLDPAELGVTLASLTPSWTQRRIDVSRGAPIPVPVSPAHASWMDDAMFARWSIGFLPDISEIRSDVEFLAPPGVATRIACTIETAFAVFDEEPGRPAE